MNIDQQREQAITRLYNTPLPNNPNRTYGQVYSPPELAILMVAKNDAIRDAEIQAGNLTQERYNDILNKVPELDKKLAIYNVPPIPYTLEMASPELAATIEEEGRPYGEAYQRRIDAQLRGNYPSDYAGPQRGKPHRFDRKQKIASYGIDPDNPYFFKGQENHRNFYYALSFAPDSYTHQTLPTTRYE